ncbi:MAG TPA: hypothetical protein DEA97_06925 [Bacteroidales bacterium]|nr:MAG: hypothetical protein UR43_C0013G0026 [candidate division TM6 bacterium GW2011_GWF2_33_332]OFY78408.1 MAG: hypothetical protein A2281_11980 [Bacteroidetes bacterium RIFOXYA12_FULL_38_20]HBS86270.1 hypothetical protein [Bacteroidales bacterium]
MQNKTFKNFVQKILNKGKISASQVGNSIKRSSDFTTLLNGGFIEYIPAVTGGGSFLIKNKEALEKYFSQKFPEELKNNLTAVDNVHSFRNTKAGKRESQNVILIRGHQIVLLNYIETNLEEYTNKYGTFSATLQSLETEKVCFVENLDSYLLAEQVIPNDFVFIHTYGGIGRSIVSKVKAKEILVFPDYDFKGLHNYLLVKSVFPKTKLFVPKDYEELFVTKSRTIKTRQGREQQPSKQVLECEEKIVEKIRNDIFRHKKFLEQQAVFK